MPTLKLIGSSPLLNASDTLSIGTVDRFDLSELTWASPYDVAVIVLLWQQTTLKQQPVELVLPVNPQVTRYLADIGMSRFITADWGSTEGAGVQPPWLPLTRIHRSEDWDDAAQELLPIAREALGTYQLTRSTMDILSELIDNAATHGLSDAGTFVCAQRYSGKTSGQPPGIALAIVDAGVGIPDHLRRNPKYAEIAEDQELIRLARRPWVTGTADRRGWGLVEVFQDAAASGPSRILIRSGRGEGEFDLRPNLSPRARYLTLDQAIPGTWIYVYVNAP